MCIDIFQAIVKFPVATTIKDINTKKRKNTTFVSGFFVQPKKILAKCEMCFITLWNSKKRME